MRYKDYKVTYNIIKSINDKTIIKVDTMIIKDVLNTNNLIYMIAPKLLISMYLIKITKIEEI